MKRNERNYIKGNEMAKADTGEVNIHGKIYLTVARRISDFRAAHPDYQITTELVQSDDEKVIMKATIANDQGFVISTGYAEEVRKASKINSTSATENAETSAVGRCLAFYGMGGTEIASADEVAGAIAHQNNDQALEPLMKMMEVVRDNITAVALIKEIINTEEGEIDWSYFAQIWGEFTEDEKRALWIAPSKGGVFTTSERAAFKTDEFNAARKANV